MWLQHSGKKKVYFMLKRSITKEEQFKEFLMQLDNELRFRLAKNTYEKIMAIIFDNVSIHKTKAVKQLIKNLNGLHLLFHLILQS